MSMLMVVCMLGTISVSAAVDWTTDAAITMVADSTSVKVGEEVVITVGIKGDTSGEIGMYGTAKVVPLWDVAAFEYVSSEVDSTTFELTASPAVATTTTASGYVTFSQKVGADDELPTGDYIFGTLTLKAIKEGTTTISLRSTTSTKVTQVASPKATNTVELPETLTVAIEVTGNEPVTPDDVVLSEETFEEGAKAIEEGATIKYGDKEVVAGANAKIYTFFSKAAKELLPETYGVTATIGGKAYKFPGAATVSAGQNWAIQFIVPNGEFSDKVAIENITAVPYAD